MKSSTKRFIFYLFDSYMFQASLHYLQGVLKLKKVNLFEFTFASPAVPRMFCLRTWF